MQCTALKKIVKWFLRRLPVTKTILFESCPDLSDNTKPVFDELIRRGYNKEYKFIWMCYDDIKKTYPVIKNVTYIDVRKHHIKSSLLNYTSKITICCNRFLGKKRKGQTNFYLMHGIPLKSVRSYYQVPSNINKMITPSSQINQLCSTELGMDISNCIPLGYPRNDVFFRSKPYKLKDYFGCFKKYIIWYPTVKQFKGGRLTGAIKPIALLDNEPDVLRINQKARELDILIIVKPHFAQITSLIKEIKLSNIVFINDEFFAKNSISSYEFVSLSDALLTDYSSIYYDYTLCNKPIGLIWNDIEEYKSDPGLIPEYNELTRGGEKIYTVDDLDLFMERISNGIDTLKIKRNQIYDMVNCSKEGNSTERVVDYISEYLNY